MMEEEDGVVNTERFAIVERCQQYGLLQQCPQSRGSGRPHKVLSCIDIMRTRKHVFNHSINVKESSKQILIHSEQE